jgi:hypothetical protein
MTGRRELRRQLREAQARITFVIGQRNEANSRAATAEFNQKRLARQVSELRDQIAAAEDTASGAGTSTEGATA